MFMRLTKNLPRFISLGNDNIHLLTNDGRRYKLLVDLDGFNGTTRYTEYADFKIGASREQYQLLSLGAYNGTAGEFTCLLLF
jgi:ficolin